MWALRPTGGNVRNDAQPKAKPPDKASRPQASPKGALPRRLSRRQAAAFVGISATMFDAMVADGRMPQAETDRRSTGVDRRRLDEAFDGCRLADHMADGVCGRATYSAHTGGGRSKGKRGLSTLITVTMT